MPKSRVEACDDAVIAIIMTIMIREIKVPETASFSGIIEQLPYFAAFVISAIMISTGWYNLMNIFKSIKVVSKPAFWSNILFLLCMSPAPMATAWVARFPFSRHTEYFYFFVFIVWYLSYYLLDYLLVKGNQREFSNDKIKQHQRINRFHLAIEVSCALISLVIIYFFPLWGIIFSILTALSWILYSCFK